VHVDHQPVPCLLEEAFNFEYCEKDRQCREDVRCRHRCTRQSWVPSLSQQLAVLRRSGIVTATRHGTTVVYALAGGDVAELMRAARRILTEMLAGQNQLLAELRESLTEPA
jgi:hypothetical protein